MELEHAFQQSTSFLAFQFIFMSSLLVPGFLGRPDIYRSFVNTLISYGVSFGPFALLIYMLYKVSQWQ